MDIYIGPSANNNERVNDQEKNDVKLVTITYESFASIIKQSYNQSEQYLYTPS